MMKDQYKDDISFDVIDNIWALFGTAVHHILESAKSETLIKEERLYADIDGWKLSGAIDQQEIDDDGINIIDYKVTSVWSVIYDKQAWHEQLNCYAHLVEMNKDKPVKSLKICAILRDWQQRDAKNKQNYPQAPIVLVDIPVWNFNERDVYVRSRVALHKSATDMVNVMADTATSGCLLFLSVPMLRDGHNLANGQSWLRVLRMPRNSVILRRRQRILWLTISSIGNPIFSLEKGNLKDVLATIVQLPTYVTNGKKKERQ